MSVQGWPDDTLRQSSSLLYKKISAASTNAANVKASAGVITGYFLSNQGALVAYVKLYDKSSSPTVGSDTPVATLAVPAGASAHLSLISPLSFDNGIGLAMTGGPGDSDTTAVAADEVIANVWYQ